MYKKKLSPRHLSRSLAVRALYNNQLNPKTIGELEDFLSNNNPNVFTQANYELLHYLVEKGISNFADTLNLYSEFSTRPINEIQAVEQAILVIAAIELQFSHSVPAAVIINEAIELAKLYAGEESHRFINGLVDKLAIKLRTAEIQAR